MNDNPCSTPDVYVHVQKHAKMVREIWPDSSAELKKLFPEFAAKYAQVKDSALPNFMGVRLPVESGLNIPQWHAALGAYHDSELCSSFARIRLASRFSK